MCGSCQCGEDEPPYARGDAPRATDNGDCFERKESRKASEGDFLAERPKEEGERREKNAAPLSRACPPRRFGRLWPDEERQKDKETCQRVCPSADPSHALREPRKQSKERHREEGGEKARFPLSRHEEDEDGIQQVEEDVRKMKSAGEPLPERPVEGVAEGY